MVYFAVHEPRLRSRKIARVERDWLKSSVPAVTFDAVPHRT